MFLALLLGGDSTGDVVGKEAEEQLPLIVLGLLAVIPGTISVLLFIGDAGRNTALPERQRKRWRLLIAAMPYSLVAYWWQFGRRRAAGQVSASGDHSAQGEGALAVVPRGVWVAATVICAVAVAALLADGFWWAAIFPFIGALLSGALARIPR